MTLSHLETIMRAGLIVIGPAAAVAVLVGDDFLDLILGGSFSAGRTIVTLVALSGLFVGILAMQLPLLAACAPSRYRAVAALAIAANAVHVAASTVAPELGSIAWLGVAASLSSLTVIVAASLSSLSAMALIVWLVHRRGTGRAPSIVGRETGSSRSRASSRSDRPGLAQRRSARAVGPRRRGSGPHRFRRRCAPLRCPSTWSWSAACSGAWRRVACVQPPSDGSRAPPERHYAAAIVGNLGALGAFLQTNA